MNKPNPEFEIDEPPVVDDEGRSPNKEEVIDPDAREIEAGANRSGEQGISNRPQDEQDEHATDIASGNESGSEDDSEAQDDVSASDRGEAGNLGRDASATQGNQKMNGPGDRSRQGQNKGQNQDQNNDQKQDQDRSANRSTQGSEAERTAKNPGSSHTNPVNTQRKPQGSGTGPDKRSVN